MKRRLFISAGMSGTTALLASCMGLTNDSETQNNPDNSQNDPDSNQNDTDADQDGTDTEDSTPETTIVANRAPDGSRRSSRPDGPVYHTTEGTVHLFTWDEPTSQAHAVLYDEDERTDWGEGPDVHVYDTMDRPGASSGDVPSRVATQGTWDSYTGLPTLHSDAHSGTHATRVHNKDTIHKYRARFQETTEVFLSYCVKIPEGRSMPGTENPGEFPDQSVWKMAWFSHDDWWNDVDVIVPSWTPVPNIGSNSLDVDVWGNKEPDWWQWGEWVRFAFWLECGSNPESDPGRIRWQVVTEGEQTQVLADEEVPIMEGGEPPYAWKRLNLPGWAQNKDVSGDNVEVLYDDIYLATGANANARVELSDNDTYGDSTRIQLCEIRSWSSNRVSVVLRSGPLDSIRDSAIHLTTADERQAISMEVS